MIKYFYFENLFKNYNFHPTCTIFLYWVKSIIITKPFFNNTIC